MHTRVFRGDVESGLKLVVKWFRKRLNVCLCVQVWERERNVRSWWIWVKEYGSFFWTVLATLCESKIILTSFFKWKLLSSDRTVKQWFSNLGNLRHKHLWQPDKIFRLFSQKNCINSKCCIQFSESSWMPSSLCGNLRLKEFSHKPTHLWAPYLWQRRREYTVGQRQFLQ